MPVYLNAEATLASRLRRRVAQPSAPVLPVAIQLNSHPSTDENVIAEALETVATGGGTGSHYVPGVLGWRVTKTITAGGTTYVTLINASQARRVIIDYRCTQDGNTQWGEIDICLLDDGSTVEISTSRRRPSGGGRVGVTFNGSISVDGDLILTVHGDGTGSGSIVFSGTCRCVV